LLFLLFFGPLVPLVMVVIVSLENGGLVSLAPPDTVVSAHDVSKLVKCLEDVDSNASISRCRLQHPKVLVVVAAVCQLVCSFQRFFLLRLALIQLLINNFNILVNVLINQFHYTQELFHSVTHIVFQVVKHNCQRHNVIDVHFLSLVICLEVDEKVVLGCQCSMSFDMVNQLFEAVLRDHIVFYTARSWLPFEVIQGIVMVVCWLPSRGRHSILILGIVARL